MLKNKYNIATENQFMSDVELSHIIRQFESEKYLPLSNHLPASHSESKGNNVEIALVKLMENV
jgi:hypothetical protein